LSVIPAKAGIQYFRAFVFTDRLSGILDRPVKPDDDDDTVATPLNVLIA
jgi:hypothetical protein